MQVLGADGATWSVKRRILPRRRNLLKRGSDSDPDSDSRPSLGDLADAFSTGSVLLDLVASIMMPVVRVLTILFRGMTHTDRADRVTTTRSGTATAS